MKKRYHTLPPAVPERVIAVYADGGSIRCAPSLFGGTWAWVHVGEDGQYVQEAAGVLRPDDIEGRPVRSDLMEVYALILALEALPDGWSGTVHSDSTGALQVISGAKLGNIPMRWATRIRMERKRLGALVLKHIKGHPTLTDLELGHCEGNKDQLVSPHNVYVDRRCHEVGKRAYRTILHGHAPVKGAFSW